MTVCNLSQVSRQKDLDKDKLNIFKVWIILFDTKSNICIVENAIAAAHVLENQK